MAWATMMNNFVQLCTKQASLPASRRRFPSSHPALSSLNFAKISGISSRPIIKNDAVPQQKFNPPGFVACRVRCMSESSGNNAKGAGKFEYPTEQRKRDHEHCVEMVRTRDMEGYCEWVLFFCANFPLWKFICV